MLLEFCIFVLPNFGGEDQAIWSGLGSNLASKYGVKSWQIRSQIEVANFLCFLMIFNWFLISFLLTDPPFLLAWPVFCKVFRFFMLSELELFFCQNIFKKHLQNEVQIMKKQVCKTYFVQHWFLFEFSSNLEPNWTPKMTELPYGIWSILVNASLWWLQLVFLHVREAFGTILGGFGEHVGTIFEEIRQDLDGLAEIFW